MNTTWPRPRSRMPGSTFRVRTSGATRFTATIHSSSRRSKRSYAAVSSTPALFTSRSPGPIAYSARAHVNRVAEAHGLLVDHVLDPPERDDVRVRHEADGVREQQHPVRDALAEHVVRGPELVGVRGVPVARERREVHDVGLGDGAL